MTDYFITNRTQEWRDLLQRVECLEQFRLELEKDSELNPRQTEPDHEGAVQQA